MNKTLKFLKSIAEREKSGKGYLILIEEKKNQREKEKEKAIKREVFD